MGSIPKRRKLSVEPNLEQCEDRISNLPSSLISHILTFLPTKYVLASSVLSTRWKQCWTLVTTLDFDDSLLLLPGQDNSSLNRRFTSFVYRVLLFRRVSFLKKFRLICCRSYDVSDVNAWVLASLMSGIQELELSIPMKHSTDHVLPRGLFSCRTLVVLKLGTQFVMNVPTSVCLPSLKILHLDTIIFLDDDSIKRLLLGCPVIDELSMIDCVVKDTRVVRIVAPVLTKLSVSLLDGRNYEYNIVLDTPSLLYLELIDSVEEVHLVKDLCHLIEADISTRDQFELTNSKVVIDLLNVISKVQRIRLHHEFVEAINKFSYQLPIFHNLTKLDIGMNGFLGWELLLQFLEKSPRLETLVYYEVGGHGCLDVFYEEDGPLHWNPPQNVPSCLVFHLKVILIDDFQGHEEELKMVEYFLKNAEVLEKLTIRSYSYAVKVADVTKKLLMLQRGSRTCRVEYELL